MLKQSKIYLCEFNNTFPVDYSKNNKRFEVGVTVIEPSSPLESQVKYLREHCIVFALEKGNNIEKT